MEALHPSAVHFPIVLAVIWPAIDAAGLVLGRDQLAGVAIALLGAALLAAILATVTGQAAFDVAVARGFAPAILEEHEDTASLVPWLLLAALGLRLYGRRVRRARIAAVVFGFLVAALVLEAGHSGGALVFEHGVGVAGRSP